jgi:hypothetical protein
MKPRSARLAGLGAVVVVVAADTAAAVETAAVVVETAAVVVETAVAVAAAHAAGNCRASFHLSKADNVGEAGPLAPAHHISLS